MKIRSNIFSVFVMKLQNMLVPFVLLPYVYNYHHDHVIDYAWIWGSYLFYNTIIDFGAGVLGSYVVAKKIFSFDFIKTLLILRIFLWLGISLFLFMGENRYGGMLSIVLVFSVFNVSFFYQGRLANTFLLKQEMVTKVPYVVFVILVSHFVSLPLTVLLGLLGIGFTKLVINSRLIWVFLLRGSAYEGRGYVKSLLWFAGARTSSMAAAEGTQVFITGFSESVKSDFPMVQLVYKASQNIGTIVSQVLTPYWSNKNPRELRNNKYKIIFVYVLVLFLYLVLWLFLVRSSWLNANVFPLQLYSVELSYFFAAGYISNINVLIGFPIHGLYQILDKANVGVIMGGIIYIYGIVIFCKDIFDLSLTLFLFESTVLVLRLITLRFYGIRGIK